MTAFCGPTRWVGLFFGLGSLAACDGSSTTCRANTDCFAHEICRDGTCVPEENAATNNGIANNGAGNNGTAGGTANNGGSTANNNGTVNNGGTNNATSNNGADAGNTAASDMGLEVACLIDPFGNQCTADEWEPNAGYNPGTGSDQHSLPWESDSWCDAGGNLVMPTRTLDATFCAADGADAYRFVVANAGPVCITGQTVTFVMRVELLTDCYTDLIVIEPYTIGLDPVRNDLCADDPNVRCGWQDGTFTVEWLWEVDQYMDPRLQISTTRDDVQFDYRVTVEIIPQ